MAINGIHYDVAVKVTDQILNQLTLGEEEIVEILANAYSESNFCIPCRGLFALQASALAHKTCCIERLEQIRDIADKDYGKAYIAEQALLSGKEGEGR